MNIQIFGASKCFDTKKAERYFKERKIKYQLIDILKYGLSKGEFNSVKNSVGLRSLININAKEYKTLNMQFLGIGECAEEVLIKNPKLFNTPIVRNGKLATVGYQPDIWKDWEWDKLREIYLFEEEYCIIQCEDNKNSVIDCAIHIDTIDVLFRNYFNKFDIIYKTENRNCIECNDIVAYGKSKFVAIFFKYNQEKLIKQIWINLDVFTKSDIKDSVHIISIINRLGEFILTDHINSIEIKIDDEFKIKEYLVKLKNDGDMI